MAVANGYATVPDEVDASNNDAGLAVPTPTNPPDLMRSLSLPAVSNDIVSPAGNLILVSVSPS